MSVDAPRGISKHRFYKRWNDMVQRCYNPDDVNYPNYGGRGITMDPMWDRTHPTGAANFIEWLETEIAKLPEEKKGLSFIVGRAHVNDDYAPNNCFLTNNTEASQKRRTVILNVDKVIMMRRYKKQNMNTTLAEMCSMFDIEHIYTLSRCLLGVSWSNVNDKEAPLLTLYVDRRATSRAGRLPDCPKQTTKELSCLSTME